MTPSLRISRELSLPLEFVTKTCGILAQRRKGKTYTASVIAEELVGAKVPFVVLDPTGAWWGLRASADGQKAGLPVVILGGQHGDVPLERTGGKFVAELVVDEPGYYVIDFSLFESGDAERQFATDFAERLYRRKGQPNSDFALHLIVDEADRFAPQQPPPGDKRMLGAFEAIVRRGGLRGLGSTLITQRAAVINKNVLEQVDLLIVLRIVGPNDRDAIERYVKAHGTDEERKALMDSLSSLDLGEAWVWEPGADPPLFERIRVRERHTFNSSATPKAGEKRVEPRRLADVDLDAIKEAMADTIERAKADDPKELRRQIAQLQKELKQRPTETEVREVEVPVVPSELLAVVKKATADICGYAERIDQWSQELNHKAVAFDDPELVDEDAARWVRDLRQHGSVATSGPRRSARPRATEPDRPSPERRPRRAAVSRAEEGDEIALGKGEQKVLAVLAQWPEGRTYNELAFLAGYSAKASTLGVILSKLRKAGLVEPGNSPVLLTPEGLDAAGGPQELPTGDALLAHWRRHPRMGEGERRVLDVLVDSYPEDLSHEELCDLAGYSPIASTMGVILSKLRKLGLVEKGARRLAPEFAEAIA